MLSLQYFRGPFPYNYAGRHGVAGCYARHDRSVGDTKPFDSINLEVTINNGHRIAPYFGGTGLMRICGGSFADEVLQVDAIQIARHYFPLCVAPKGSGVPNFTTELHARDRCLHIVRMRQEIVFNLNRVQRVWPCQADLSATLWLYHARQKRPACRRWAEPSC